MAYQTNSITIPRHLRRERRDRTLRSEPPRPWLENPSHLHQILDHVRGGRLPLKYAYAGSAAFTHDALAQTAGYAEVIGDARHEATTLIHAQPDGLPDQIVEVGPGNGAHTAALFDVAEQPGAAPAAQRRRYLGLDFSRTLLKFAAQTLAARTDLDVSTAHWDLEDGPTPRIEAWRRGSRPVLACLLGHTLGNLEEPGQALRNLALSLRPGDTLLVSLTLYRPDSGADSILDPYRTETFTAAVLEPLRAVAAADSAFRLKLRLVGRTVIGDAELTQPVSAADREPIGHTTVRCFASARFLLEEALSLFSPPAGWEVRHWSTDEDGAHLAIVAQRRDLRGGRRHG